MKYILATILIILSFQKTVAQFSYDENDKVFQEKYKSLIPSDESLENAWFYYIKTKLKNGKYAVRTIFPETKVITSYVEFKDKKCKQKEGKAIYWKDDGKIYKRGAYRNNKYSGPWNFYFGQYDVLSSEGQYLDGNKEGEWKEYDKRNFLSQKLFYVKDKKEGAFEQFDSLGLVLNRGEYRMDTIYMQSNSEIFSNQSQIQPLFDYECKNIIEFNEKKSCSEKSMFKYLGLNLKYPMIAREYGIEGNVLVFFIINKEGKIKDIVIPNGLCQDIKDEVFNLVSKMPDWSPGENNGKKVNVTFTMPVRFKLE